MPSPTARRRPTRARLVAALTLALGVPLVAACGSASTPSGGSDASARAGALSVVASFYPIEYAVQQVGGTHVSVHSLTKAGAEPHDIELTPKDVGMVSEAALVVYAAGFQPAVDEAVEQQGGDRAFDVAPSADLDLAAPAEEGQTPAAGAKDPHFWLDPERYQSVVTAIATELAAVDPGNAAAYTSGASAFTARLATLDADFKAGTATCANPDLVTSHAAFGYLSQRYGFTQVPIAGLDPDVEPSAAELAGIADFVRSHHVTTVYAETLVEPKFAQTIASSTGATVATLDPIEGLTSASAGRDYLEVMRSNLAALQQGQGCSPAAPATS